MKVIMLKDVAKIGRVGEIKDVADGYAINCLIPKRWAEVATSDKVHAVEAELKSRQDANKAQLVVLGNCIDSLTGQKVILKAKINEKGHLYRELKNKDISHAIKEQLEMNIPEECIKTTSHIREAGKFTIPLDGGGKKGSFELEIVSQE
jgi:large subunit ribosomal protein L9